MIAYTLRRLLVAVLVAVAVSVIAFMLVRMTGDLATALAGEDAKPADIERIRHQYGLDRPVILQYAEWLRQAVTGSFGKSIYYPETVMDLIETRLPVTLTLSFFGLLVSLGVGIPFGVLAALRPNSWLDRFAMTVAVLGQAMPTFWFALMLMVIFGLFLQVLPVSGYDTWENYVLPSVALGYFATPAIMRLTRSGMIEVLQADYIRTAHAKGLRTGTVLFKHALRNAVIPVVALASVQFGAMLSGSVVIESVFAMQGLGFLAWESISRKDFPVVQAILLIVACFYIFLTFAADLLNAWLDPRIRVR